MINFDPMEPKTWPEPETVNEKLVRTEKEATDILTKAFVAIILLAMGAVILFLTWACIIAIKGIAGVLS